MRNPKNVSAAPGAGILSQTAQYALRVIAELARRPRARPVRATDLSESTGVPTHYLSKVSRRLVEHGLLHSQRGHGGGFVLARAPADITVAQVLAAVDAVPHSNCAFGWGACNVEAPCPLHDMWKALHDSFFEWAADATFEPSETPCEGAPPQSSS